MSEETQARPSTDPERSNNLRLAYEFARETRDHCDTLLWEVAAIIWGGQTLLLGFVLEAITRQSEALILILLVSAVGVMMAVFNRKIMRTRNDVCNDMIAMMIELEGKLGMEVTPQRILSERYPIGRQKNLSLMLDAAFGTVWVVVFLFTFSMIVGWPKV